MDDLHADDDGFLGDPHERFLQELLLALLRGDDLDQLCAGADLPALHDAGNEPVSIAEARSFRDAQVLTLNYGIYLQLSDGSAFTLSIGVSRRPTEPTSPHHT